MTTTPDRYELRPAEEGDLEDVVGLCGETDRALGVPSALYQGVGMIVHRRYDLFDPGTSESAGQ